MKEVESLILHDNRRTDLKPYKVGHTFERGRINSCTEYLIKPLKSHDYSLTKTVHPFICSTTSPPQPTPIPTRVQMVIFVSGRTVSETDAESHPGSEQIKKQLQAYSANSLQ